MHTSSITIPMGMMHRETITEDDLRVAQRELLENSIGERRKRLIDAVLSYMCVTVLKAAN